MPKARGRDERPEAEGAGARGEPGKSGPRIERAALPRRTDRRVVVGAKERVEETIVTGLRKGDPLIPGHVLLALDHETDLHPHVPFRARRAENCSPADLDRDAPVWKLPDVRAFLLGLGTSLLIAGCTAGDNATNRLGLPAWSMATRSR